MQEEINMLEGTPFSAPPRNRNLPDDQQEDVEGASTGMDPQEPGSTIRGMETEGPAETDEDNPTEDDDTSAGSTYNRSGDCYMSQLVWYISCCVPTNFSLCPNCINL